MTADLVSVVIPNYNYARFLRQSIDSVLAQSHRNFEVLVIDDGSKDDSAAVLDSYGDKIRWFRQQNQGVSVARNKGISEGRGEFVAFLDADDIWEPRKLEKQLPGFADTRVGLVYSGITYVDIEGRPIGTNLAGSEGELLLEHALYRPSVLAGGSTALVRKSCFQQTGGFEPRLSTSADWDMWRRLMCYHRVVKVAEPLVQYRLHGSAMHRNVALFERDSRLAFERMFSDPAAAAVWPYKRDCYASLYLSLCTSYLHARNWKKAGEYAWQTSRQRPLRLPLHALKLPLRRLRHLLRPDEQAFH